MSGDTLVGSRIRERRVMLGVKQSELARQAGISPSYLNLIEHNRRRIGGKTLLTLAELLKVEPTQLSEGAEATLLNALRVAAQSDEDTSAELERTEEFAGRFPGWAQLLIKLMQRSEALEQTVKTLTDRLANDPQLAASLHDVISTVTAIRSTASILVDTKTLEPEWQARFHRNINEDSRRLAEGAEALVRYLEAAPDTDEEIRSPLDEMHAYLAAKDYSIPEVESSVGDARIGAIVAQAEELASDGARHLAERWLHQCYRDAQALPLSDLREAIARHGLDPEALAEALDLGLPLLFRRLAMLPSKEFGPIGLVSCDASGTFLFRKPVPGFSIPQGAGACSLWPLFGALLNPLTAHVAPLLQAGRNQMPVMSYAVAETVSPSRFSAAPGLTALMLLLPGRVADDRQEPRVVGATCRVCPVTTCGARREPSLLGEGF
ncbi:helix-turn-helix domain-containing protein [Roseovarius faecimaris]|uniref:Helix-turn-helix domain-containing protein n=1 Tax=Roseovarius faecimaris TaxID=2494550 RepID=A0A6I6IQE1_9RHOB|nr:helix-turn-helix domain-containing protein [Roseovarius faecimaris]QGX98482.1 helix-turn-helix domain-containing protein [Roseovarius faecimaris]